MGIAPVKVPRELLAVQQTVLEVGSYFGCSHAPRSAAIIRLRQSRGGDLGTEWHGSAFQKERIMPVNVLKCYTAKQGMVAAFGCAMALLHSRTRVGVHCSGKPMRFKRTPPAFRMPMYNRYQSHSRACLFCFCWTHLCKHGASA